MFYCYVLRSKKTGRRYVGCCENLRDPRLSWRGRTSSGNHRRF